MQEGFVLPLGQAEIQLLTLGLSSAPDFLLLLSVHAYELRDDKSIAGEEGQT